ncbi:TRADD-N-associated membrane domain-containing protein [Streptomyces cellostaticus]|uniref:TRADD-N-associated membrane domain-containing protein n=1 Tax=Streptomyces cellostaticus TaxID=67285 RepID=UPI000AFB5B52|nr:hypothetical protein [Streptomyces cellostaticus]GHI07742.1 hypothetical protein Scel_60630 [Streptomyces cellostaticus]
MSSDSNEPEDPATNKRIGAAVEPSQAEVVKDREPKLDSQEPTEQQESKPEEQETPSDTGSGTGGKIANWLGTILLILIIISWVGNKKSSKGPPWLWQLVLAVAAAAIAAGFIAMIMLLKRRERERRRELQRLETAADRLRERVELPSLINFNRVLLDQYHEIATRQANKSFRAALTAMAIGLCVIVATLVASFAKTSSGDRLFLGSLAAVSAALTGYLGRTYINVYDRSIRQLNQYFNQPVLNNYFLTAERITSRLSEEHREELLVLIAKEILATGTRMHEFLEVEDKGKVGILGKVKPEQASPGEIQQNKDHHSQSAGEKG